MGNRIQAFLGVLLLSACSLTYWTQPSVETNEAGTSTAIAETIAVKTQNSEETQTIEPVPSDTPPALIDTSTLPSTTPVFPTPSEPIGDCNTSAPVFPCWFEITDRTDSPEIIANNLYDDYWKANLIAALHRDQKGKIDRFDPGDILLIPPPDSTINLDFYKKYLPLISEERGTDITIDVCSNEHTNKPCFYFVPAYWGVDRIIRETYPERVGQRPRTFFDAANKLNVVGISGESFPVELSAPEYFQKDDIVVLPSYP